MPNPIKVRRPPKRPHRKQGRYLPLVGELMGVRTGTGRTLVLGRAVLVDGDTATVRRADGTTMLVEF